MLLVRCVNMPAAAGSPGTRARGKSVEVFMRCYRRLFFLLILLLVGCTTPVGAAGGSTTCVPGTQITCACSGGGKGIQTCVPGGNGFGACAQCGVGDALSSDATPTGADAKGVDGSDAAGQEVASDAPDGGEVTGEIGPPVTCSDGAKNALETDIDCGGPQCAPCSPNKGCAIGTDCKSAICLNKVCQLPVACTDGKKNELETDIDCGGGACQPCGTGKRCQMQDDCADKSGVNGLSESSTT